MQNFSDSAVTTDRPAQLGVHPLGEVVAGRLRAARKDAGLTLQDMAVRCKTTAQTIQRLETYNMTLSIDWVEKMAKAVGVEPHLLLADLDAPPQVFAQRLRKAREEAAVLRARAEAFVASLDQFLQITAEEVAPCPPASS